MIIVRFTPLQTIVDPKPKKKNIVNHCFKLVKFCQKCEMKNKFFFKKWNYFGRFQWSKWWREKKKKKWKSSYFYNWLLLYSHEHQMLVLKKCILYLEYSQILLNLHRDHSHLFNIFCRGLSPNFFGGHFGEISHPR